MAFRDWFTRTRAPSAESATKTETAAAVDPVTFPADYRPDWFGRMGAGSPSISDPMGSTAVYTVVSVLAQEISSIRAWHMRRSPKLGSRRVPSSVAQQTLDRPNDYQTRTDFWLAVVASLCLRGASFAVGRWQPGSEHPVEMHFRHPDTVLPMVDDRGAVAYQVSVSRGDPALSFLRPGLNLIPAREMLHLRMFTSDNPLIGVTPLRSIRFSMAHGTAIQASQWQFFEQSSRPGGLLTNEKPLTPEQARRLREQWKEFSRGGGGSTGVLDGGWKWQALSLTAEESQLVDQYKLTLADAARIYRVPPWLVGLMEQASFNNVETMYRAFYVQSIRWYLEHFEAALSRFMRFGPNEDAEFDIESALMRSEFGNRVKAFGEATRSGLYTINESREWEGLPHVEGGDVPLVQAQMVPLDQVRSVHDRPPAPPPPAPVDPPPDEALEAATRKLQAAALERLQLSAELGAARSELARLRGAA